MSISITSLSRTVALIRGEEQLLGGASWLLRLLEGELLQEGVALREEESAV